MKAKWLTALVMAGGFGLISNAEADINKPGLGWQTRAGAVVCASYFQVRDGEKAITAGDRNWLAETGCIIAPGGLRLVLLDTSDHADAWRARIYGLGGKESQTVYLSSYYVVNFVDAGTYQSEKEAEAVFAEMQRRHKRRHNKDTDQAYRVQPFGPDKFKLWIGPSPINRLRYFCSDVREDRETDQEFMARTKRESDAYIQKLNAYSQKSKTMVDAGPYPQRPSDKAPPLGKKLICDPPSLY